MVTFRRLVSCGFIAAAMVLCLIPVAEAASSDSSLCVDSGTVLDDIKSFIQNWCDEYVIDTTGPEPTIELVLSYPTDTVFLDSLGKFYGPKTGSSVNYEIPLAKLKRLIARKDIRWRYARRVYIPERWSYFANYGRLIIEPCPIPYEWFPITVRIQRVDGSCLRPIGQHWDTSPSDTIQIVSVEQTQLVVDKLLPGWYSCTFELDSACVRSLSPDSAEGIVPECTRVIVDSLFVDGGRSTIVETSVVFGLKASRYIERHTDPCHVVIYYTELRKYQMY